MVIGYCPNSPTLVVREGNMSFNLNLTCPVNITGSTFCLRNGEVHVPSLPTGCEDDIPSNSEVADSSSTSNDNPITSAADLLRRVRIGQPIVPRNPEVERERPFQISFGDRQNIRVNVNDGPRRLSGQFNDLPLNEGQTPRQIMDLDHPLQRGDLHDVGAPPQDRQSISPDINTSQRRLGSRFLSRHTDNEDADILPNPEADDNFPGLERHNLGEASQHRQNEIANENNRPSTFSGNLGDRSFAGSRRNSVTDSVYENGRNANRDLVHPGQIPLGMRGLANPDFNNPTSMTATNPNAPNTRSDFIVPRPQHPQSAVPFHEQPPHEHILHCIWDRLDRLEIRAHNAPQDMGTPAPPSSYRPGTQLSQSNTYLPNSTSQLNSQTWTQTPGHERQGHRRANNRQPYTTENFHEQVHSSIAQGNSRHVHFDNCCVSIRSFSQIANLKGDVVLSVNQGGMS
jgi:hypothetical protein